MKKLLSLLWILLLLFILPSELSAADPDDSIGSVVAIRGKVTAVDPEGAVRKLSLKSNIYRDDTLKTGNRSRLQVMFIDNTIVSLGPNSEMSIAEYEWKPDEGDGGMKTKIKEGVFRIMGGAITKVAPDKFTTETPAATIGIRGSMYAGRVSDGVLTVVFQGGRGIYVTNPAGTVDISIPGYGTRVEGAAEAPETPEPFTAEEITDLNNELSASGGSAGEEESSNSTDGNDNAETDKDSAKDDTNEENNSTENTDEPAGDEKQDATDQPSDQQDPASNPEDDKDNDDGSIVAANTTPSENDGAADSDANPMATAEPAESLTAGASNDLGNELSTDSGITDNAFIDTTDTISVSLATVQDTLTDSVQSDLNETEVEPEPAAADTSEPLDALTTDTANDQPTTTTTIIAVETTTTTTTTIQTVTTTDPPAPPAPTIANFSGKYLAVQFDIDTGTNTNDAIWSGSIAPQSTDGLVEGTVTADQDSKEIPYQFQIATYDSSGTYTGASTGTADHTVNLVVLDRNFTNGVELHWSDLGEFIAFYLPASNFDSGAYKFQELGFAGIPSATLPSNGVEAYSGHILAAITEASNIDADHSSLDVEVNWHNEKVLGRINGTDSKIVFFGDLSGNSLINIKFFGDGKDGATPTAVDGSEDFGKFYGSQHQGFGMTASGNTYAVYDQANVNTWSAIGAGFRVYENPLNDPVAPTGSTLWEGFATGRADDMDNPTVNRRLYLSSGTSDLQFNVDKDAGAISGTLSASDALGTGYLIVNMVVGGANGSAFVLHDNFAAALGDGGADVITDGTNFGGLKTYGNYMASMPPEDQFSEYVTWGYWEAAYVDPTSAAQYHIHQPGSLWIAGERTPAGYVQGLIDASAFVGNYQGPAHGIGISPGGVVTELTGGATNLTIDFSQIAVGDKIAGTIAFDQANFSVAGATATSDGFTANFTNGTVQSSTVNGAYFGPMAEAIGGNFHADMVSGEQYLGIFGGNKTP